MNQQKLEMGGQSTRTNAGGLPWWLSAGLGLAAVAAIAIAIYLAVPPAGAPSAANAADAAEQARVAFRRGEWNAGNVNIYAPLDAHDRHPDVAAGEALPLEFQRYLWYGGQAAAAVPDANARAVNDYLRAHGVGQPVFDPSNRPSVHDDPMYHSPVAAVIARLDELARIKDEGLAAVDRSFHTPQTSDYVLPQPADRSFHTPETSNYVLPQTSNYGLDAPTGQAVPDAIGQSYFLQLQPAQTSADGATRGVLQYLRAHGANVVIP